MSQNELYPSFKIADMPSLMRPQIPEAYQTVCGERIPYGNIHAVSMSLPSVSDVTGYEERLTETLSRLKAGYPRFVAHAYVERIIDLKLAQLQAKSSVFVVNSEKAAQEIIDKFSPENSVIENDLGIVTISSQTSEEKTKKILSFIQHTGCLISSRKAEDYLIAKKILAQPFAEKGLAQNAIEKIISEFEKIYAPDAIETHLTVSGMNAVYASFKAIENIRGKQNKKIWVRLGWLYVDNIHLLSKYASGTRVFQNVHDLNELELFLREHGKNVAGVLTETPTNPLIQVPDYGKIRGLLDQYDIPLVADISVAGSVVVNVIPYADIIIESLTKFAGGNADVMMGAVILNSQSQFFTQLNDEIPKLVENPYGRDLARMAYLIQDYRKRMKCISDNTRVLADFFSSHKKIKELHWSGSAQNVAFFSQIARDADLQCGVISIVPSGKLSDFYDRLSLYKGPSFGTEFTLNMLYMYLAHYELVSDATKYDIMSKAGLSPNLIRISVGCEEPSGLVAAYENALV